MKRCGKICSVVEPSGWEIKISDPWIRCRCSVETLKSFAKECSFIHKIFLQVKRSGEELCKSVVDGGDKEYSRMPTKFILQRTVLMMHLFKHIYFF